MNSYLSGYVQSLFEISNGGETDHDVLQGKYVDTSNVIFQMHEVGPLLDNSAEIVTIHAQGEEWFRQKIEAIAPVLRECSTVLDSSETVIGHVNKSDLLQWTHRVDEIDAYWKLYKNRDNRCRNALVVLGLSAIIERSLGNVFLLKGNTVPFLLRDLLDTVEIREILGEKIVFLMQLLFGTPKGLNIRNVTWHGFPNCDELKSHHAAVLFVFLRHVGPLLENRHRNVRVPERPLNVTLVRSWDEISAEHVFVDLRDHGNATAAKNILTQDAGGGKKFVGDQHAVIWSQIFDYFQTGNGAFALVLLLPLFEHTMRIVFCLANNCPRRLLTAEHTEFYTTLEEIFNRNISNSTCINGESLPNRIYDRVSENAIELYEDLFVHLNGLRIRDRLSHGEINVLEIPIPTANSVANAILCLTLYFAIQFRSNPKWDPSFAEALTKNITSYRTRHHPTSILKHKLIAIRKSLHSWKDFQIPVEVKAISGTEEDLSLVASDDDNRKTMARLSIKEEISDADVKELTFAKSAETISLLQSIANNVHEASDNIIAGMGCKYVAYCERKMRSRQRDTYARMIRSLDLHNSALRSLVALAISLATSKENRCCTRDCNKFLRKTLKYAENINSNTQSDRNRWDENVQLIEQFQEYLHANSEKVPFAVRDFVVNK